MKNRGEQFLSKKIHILFLSIFIGLLFISGGYLYYNYSAQRLRTDKENDLKAIADLKIDQFVQWHKERMTDAMVLSKSRLVVKTIKEWLRNKTDLKLTSDVEDLLSKQHVYDEYRSVFLSSTAGKLLLSSGSSMSNFDSTTSAKIIESVKNSRPEFTGFYFCRTENKIHYDIVTPLIDEKNRVVAAIVLRVDPENYIYPRIQSWPTPSRTAETLLIRKEGNKILFLNELRHKKNTALKLAGELSNNDLPAAQAVRGVTGIFYGKDYRNVDVISYLSSIPNTRWFIVSKMDTDEIFSELNYRGIVIALFVFILIVTAAFGLTWIYQTRQSILYKKLWETQAEFETILRSIGDGVITTDRKGYIQFMNPVAEKLTGWNLYESKDHLLKEVFSIINEESGDVIQNPVEKVLRKGRVVGLSNHTILVSREGKEFHIADSGAPIKNETGETIGVVLAFKDQTKEWEAKQEIIRLNSVYAVLSNTNQAIVRIKDNSKLFNEICRTAVVDGKFKIAWIGMLNRESGEMEVAATAGIEAMHGESAEKNISKCEHCHFISNMAFKTSKHYIIEDLEHHSQLSKFKMEPYLKGCGSSASFPIIVFGKPVGTFNIFAAGHNYFRKDEQHLLDEMAGDIGFALEFAETERIRRISEAELLKSRDELKDYFENDISADYVADIEGKLLNCNNAFYNLFGYEKDIQLENINIRRLFKNPEGREILIEKVRTDRRVENLEMDFITKDNNVINALIHATGIFDAKDVLVQLRGYIVDISALKKAEQVLRESEERFRSITNSANDAIITADHKGIITDWNLGAEKIFGYTSDEIVGNDLTKIIPPIYVDENFTGIGTLSNMGEPKLIGQTVELTGINKDGIEFPIELSVAQWSTSKGVFFTGIIRNITERKLTENEINLLANALRSVNECVSITDMHDKILFINAAFTKTYGFSEDELIGKQMEIVRPKYIPQEIGAEILPTTIRGGWAGELINRRKDGSEFPISLSTTVIRDKNEKAVALIGIASDITKRKKAEKELLDAKLKAEESEKLKTEFLAQMSHEIRSPMHGVISLANLLREDLKENLTPEHLEFFDGIDSAGRRLIRTVDLILNSSELQVGSYKPQFTKIKLIEEIIEKILIDYGILISGKGLEINFIREVNEAKIFGDSYSVYQLFVNLMDNSIKFTHEGSITIKVEKIEDGRIILVTINDTGIGMSEEFMKMMYSPFTQEDRGYSRRYEGNGLGLSLVKKYCDLNNIAIEVESKKGIGSQFTLMMNCVD